MAGGRGGRSSRGPGTWASAQELERGKIEAALASMLAGKRLLVKLAGQETPPDADVDPNADANAQRRRPGPGRPHATHEPGASLSPVTADVRTARRAASPAAL